MSDIKEAMQSCTDTIADLEAITADMQEALERLQGGFFASLLSAASAASDNPDATVAVPIDLIKMAAGLIDETLAKSKGETP